MKNTRKLSKKKRHIQIHLKNTQNTKMLKIVFDRRLLPKTVIYSTIKFIHLYS